MKPLVGLGAPAVAGLVLVLSGLVGSGATDQAADPAAPATPTPGAPTPTPQAGPEEPVAAAEPAIDCTVLKCIALTFDDGPNEATTPRLLETLTQEQVPATFYMQGASVSAYPETAKQVAETPGMEIGAHSMTHPDLTGVSAERLTEEIAGTAELIEETTGERPTTMRPPYGSEDESVRAAAGAANQSVILWSIDTLDWQSRDPAKVAEVTLAEAEPGSIALMHDIHPSTVDAVPQIVQALKADGYTLVTVPELLGSPEPGTVHTGTEEDPA